MYIYGRYLHYHHDQYGYQGSHPGDDLQNDFDVQPNHQACRLDAGNGNPSEGMGRMVREWIDSEVDVIKIESY